MPDSNASTMARPPRMRHNFHRVAILFAGGPAPAANAVISTAATAFLRNDIEVVGVLHGYSHLVEYSPERPLVEGRDYVMVTHRMLGRTRNSQGIIIGTARANPGKNVSHPTHLDDAERAKPLKTVYEALRSINVDALISIGGDDTLKTANKFKLYQEKLPPGALRIPVVHLPKTIDNDYRGIDFTFGYFTAVDFLASRSAEFDCRCRGESGIFPGRVDGPQRGLARVWRGDFRRGEPGDQRRRHRRSLRVDGGSEESEDGAGQQAQGHGRR